MPGSRWGDSMLRLAQSAASKTRALFASLKDPRVLVATLAYAAVVLAAIYLCNRGAQEHSRVVNRDYNPKDQGAYLNLGRRTAETQRIQVDGARPPLYSALLALVYHPDLSREEYFERCKKLNIRLTLAGWILLLIPLLRRLRPPSALTVWLALGFTVFLFYAPYVKAEGIFYALSTWAFLCTLDVLFRPRVSTALLAGAVTALAQLTKESMLPGLWLFVAVQGVAVAVALTRQVRRKTRPLRLHSIARRAATIPLVLLAFLVVVYPHIRVNERVFGHYFYNVNSYFYVWYDSWGEVVRGTRKYGDRVGFPNMPKENLPSARKYFETHTAEEIEARVVKGAVGTFENALRSHGFVDYVAYAAVCGIVSLAFARRLRRFFVRRWPMALYGVGYFSGYFLLCTWFYSIHPGLRFVVMLVPPFLYLGAWCSDRLRHPLFGLLGLWTIGAGLSLTVDVPLILGVVVESAKQAGW